MPLSCALVSPPTRRRLQRRSRRAWPSWALEASRPRACRSPRPWAQTCPSSLWRTFREADARRFGADHRAATSEEGTSTAARFLRPDPAPCSPTASTTPDGMAALRPYGVRRCGPAHRSPSTAAARLRRNGGKSFAGSQTRHCRNSGMLDFCAEHGVIPAGRNDHR